MAKAVQPGEWSERTGNDLLQLLDGSPLQEQVATRRASVEESPRSHRVERIEALKILPGGPSPAANSTAASPPACPAC